MATIASLADEFGVQPYGLAAFADIAWPYDETAELDADGEAFIREAWESGHDGPVDVVKQARAEERLMDELADVVNHAGYTY